MKLSNWMARALLGGASALVCAGAVQAAPYIEPSAYVTAAEPAQPVRFEVFLPLRDKAGLESLLERQQLKTAAEYHKWLTPAQFKTRFGPSAESRARTIAALKAQGFTVSAEHTRSFEVTGTASMVAHAFSTSLLHVQPKTGVARLVANTPLVIPAALEAEGAMVVAFLGLPPHHHFSIHVPISNPENRYSAHGPYWFDDLKQAYDYPSYQTTYNNRTLDGTGVKVAVVIDADVRDSDVTAYFEEEHFAAKSGKGADPAIVHDYVDGGSALDTDGEATLDVEQVLGGAPGATVGLVNVPDLSDGSITAGYIHVIEGNYYDLVNSSFGECELIFSPPYNGGSTAAESVIQIYHSLFQQGNSQGITFIAASGDQGGVLCPDATYYTGGSSAKPKWVVGVSSPADDPDVTAVGGGNLVTAFTAPATAAPRSSAYKSENGTGDPEVPYDPSGTGVKVSGGYWGAGGGLSQFFTIPTYQQNLGVKTGSTTVRTLPDVGMQVGGCPSRASSCGADDSAVWEILNGQAGGTIGTSVASPEFVGAVALYEQFSGRQGNLNYYLYSTAAAQTARSGPAAFRHPVVGFDGEYTARQPSTSYNYIFGNGTPNVRLLFGLSSVSAAGVPQSASNP